MQVFEVDQPGTQAWKRQRLLDLGLGIAPGLHLVPVNFEAGENWWQRLSEAGFDTHRPAVDPEVRPGLQMAEKGARASGTPFLSYFMPADLLTLARESGFRTSQHVSAAMLTQRYFSNRADGLRPPTNAEELLLAIT